MGTTKVQINLRIHAVWSAPLLFTTWKYNISSFFILNFKPVPIFYGWAGQFVSYLVANPEDRFSRDGAQMYKWAASWEKGL